MLRCNKHMSVSYVRWKKCRSLASCCKKHDSPTLWIRNSTTVLFWSTPWHRRLKPMWISHYINCLWRSLIFKMILFLIMHNKRIRNSIFTVSCSSIMFLTYYTCEYSFTHPKHGHSFIGFKSWCPTISVLGNCPRNSRSKASREPFCSNVRVSFGFPFASSPPS